MIAGGTASQELPQSRGAESTCRSCVIVGKGTVLSLSPLVIQGLHVQPQVSLCSPCPLLVLLFG